MCTIIKLSIMLLTKTLYGLDCSLGFELTHDATLVFPLETKMLILVATPSWSSSTPYSPLFLNYRPFSMTLSDR